MKMNLNLQLPASFFHWTPYLMPILIFLATRPPSLLFVGVDLCVILQTLLMDNPMVSSCCSDIRASSLKGTKALPLCVPLIITGLVTAESCSLPSTGGRFVTTEVCSLPPSVGGGWSILIFSCSNGRDFRGQQSDEEEGHGRSMLLSSASVDRPCYSLLFL